MLIKVKVIPKSAKEQALSKAEDSFEVHVKGPAERGLANKKAMALLADYLRLPLQSLRLIKGAKQRHKIFEVK